jgi:hypothetical protein
MSGGEEEDRRAKQTYLRTEIIEAGFDASSFVEHLNSLKPNGDDVDEWTLEELIDAVTLFKQNQKSVLETLAQEPATDSTPGSKRTSNLSSSKRVLTETQIAALEQNKRRATLQGFVLEASDDEEEEYPLPQGMDTDVETSSFEAAVEQTPTDSPGTEEETSKLVPLVPSIPEETTASEPVRRETTQVKPQGTEKVVCASHTRNSILSCNVVRLH